MPLPAESPEDRARRVRRQYADSAVGSVRVEGLEPSAAFLADVERYVDGSLPAEELLTRVLRRYGVD